MCVFDQPYRKYRTNHGCGLLLYLNSDLAHVRRPDPEILLLRIDMFLSPKTADVNFFNQMNLSIEKAYDVTKNLIIVGDLNEDLLSPNFHNLQNILLINS